MNKKQELFVEEYLKDLNITQASLRAGYSANSKKHITEEVQLAMDNRVKERFKDCRAEVKEIIRELKRIALAPPDKTVKINDKLKALELLGKHLGMWENKLSINGDVKVNNPFENLTEEQLIKLAELEDNE